MIRVSIRTRLTLWYTGVLAVVLLLFSVGVYALLAHQLARRLDAESAHHDCRAPCGC